MTKQIILIGFLWISFGLGSVFIGIKVKPTWPMTTISAAVLTLSGPISLLTVGLAALLEKDRCLANCNK